MNIECSNRQSIFVHLEDTTEEESDADGDNLRADVGEDEECELPLLITLDNSL